MNIHKVTDQTFDEEVLANNTLTLVDFWAEWCGPCRTISPVLEAISADFGEQLKICKVNIDENPSSPTQYNVRSIPTLILFKNGQPVATQVGALPRNALSDWIREHM